MSLILCKECQKEVSNKANTCPHCGNPMHSTPVEVELTNKKWKFLKLIGGLWFVFGLFIFLIFIQQDGFQSASTGFGFSVAFVGIIMIFLGRLGAWWGNR